MLSPPSEPGFARRYQSPMLLSVPEIDMTRRRRPQSSQLSLSTRGTRGGWRPGAGRKPKPEQERRGHGPRPQLCARFPVHVTLRAQAGIPSLRRGRTVRALRQCFVAGKDRMGFRLVQFSVQSNHLHLIVEAEDAAALARGLQGLSVRVARRVNRLLGRSGKLFAERYHMHVLKTPTEVRRALVYVVGNGRKHLKAQDPDWVDSASSAVWFTGWRFPVRDMRLETEECPVTRARSWLLREGWKRAGGPLELGEGPAGRDKGAGKRPEGEES